MSRVRETGWGLVLLALALVVAYHNSFEGPFTFDDVLAISWNPELRNLSTALQENSRIDTATAVGRPLLRVTLWANYAMGGLSVRGYHVFNLMLHIGVAWILFLLSRRLLESPALRGRYGEVSSELAFAVVLLWAVHPLQTESVTFVVQRAEMLGALFYLLTLYGVVRSAEAQTRRGAIGWSVEAVLACLVGMSAKETLATAPLLALAMDRIFLSVSWRQLWRARRGLYLALAGTWIFQALLVASSSGRQGTVGFDLGVSWWEYALTQPYYLCRYLALTLWPQALTLDYGPYLARTPGEIVPYAVGVVLLLGLTVWALWRVPALGFCGLWFFLILAPTSSVVPVVTQTGAEHRMYLPLAGLLGAVVVGGYTAACRWWPSRRALRGVLAVVALLAVALGVRTVGRNEEYRTELSLWQTVVDRWPGNAGGHNSLGKALAESGRAEQAIRHYEEALRLRPSYPEAENNLAVALAQTGRPNEAILHYETALRLNPYFAEAHNNLGRVLEKVGRREAAIARYEQALRIRRELAPAHNNLANALTNSGRSQEAIAHYEQALEQQPDFPEAANNLAWLYATDPDPQNRNAAEALRWAQRAVSLSDGRDANFLDTLAAAHAEAGQLPEAISTAERALQLANASEQKALAAELEARLASYRAGKPHRRTSPKAAE